MLAEERIIQKISSAGPTGLRKTELRKEFPQPDTDVLLDKLSKDGRVFIDKKGTAYYCWIKESYMQYLLDADPKFRLTYEAINSLEHAVRTNGDRLLITIGEINSRGHPVASENAAEEHGSKDKNTLEDLDPWQNRLDSFKVNFDEAITRFSNSIGWVDFVKIRSDMCKIYDLDTDKFYSLVAELMVENPEKYELSCGGYEGLTIRGLLHGFVRHI